MDEIICDNIKNELKLGEVTFRNNTKGIEFKATVDLTDKEIEVIYAGGRLNYVKYKN